MYLSDSDRLHATDIRARQITESTYFIDDIQPLSPFYFSTIFLVYISL
jgi:hypothetical protein